MLPSRGLLRSTQTLGTRYRHIEALFLPLYKMLQFEEMLSSRSIPLYIRIRPSVDPTIAQPVSTPTDFTSTIDFSAEHLYNLPEQIGYLKSLGLDYGWGATSMMEYVLEHIHIYAGTPWWLSITLTAVFVRVVLFKPYIDASELSARMASIKHITDPIRANITAATRNRDVHATQQHRLELQKVMKRANIKVWKGFTPILQGVAGYGLFFTLRGMAHLPVPGLETGGILWFQNLTVMDPYLLLPIATAGLMHRMIKAGGETGVSTMTPTVQKYIMYGLPAITMIFTWHLPAGIQLSFFVSAILSAGQAYLLRTSWFRKFMNMTPLPTRPEPASIPAVYRVVTPPSSTAPPGSPPPAPLTGLRGIINKIPGKKTLDGTVKDIMATYQGGKEAGQKKMDGYREKQEKQEAEKYEAKRREDLKRERREWEDRKRMERARREKRR
ncbi:hypothetical protein B7494_g435 [Chlorociboria aeruginascens]|nr:hypothetical protein B7494_g435 [Chlorociboria aeruginascens]